MPIDPNIALATKPVQIENPLDVQTKVLQLRNLIGQGQAQQFSLEDAQRKNAEQKTLADLYRANINPDGTPNHAGVIQGMAAGGVGHLIPAYRKTMLDSDKDQSEINLKNSQTTENQYKVAKQRLDAAHSALGALRAKPGVTHDDVINSITELVAGGLMDAKQGQTIVAQLPPHPALLPNYLLQKDLQVADAKTRLDMLAPKFHSMDNGGSIVMGTTDPLTGQFTPGSSMQKVATPGEVLSASTQRRGQDIAANTAATSVHETPTGYTVINKAGKTPIATPVIGGDNLQVQQPKSPAWEAGQMYQKMKVAAAQARQLLPGATSSGIGAMVDKGASVVGLAPPGAEEAAQLEAIGGWMTSNVPRMQGPQSDKDTLLYRQMAGQVGDRTLPTSVRLKALETVEGLQEKYAAFNGAKPQSVVKLPVRPPLTAFGS